MEINGTECTPESSYASMALSAGMLQALDKKGFVTATDVQAGAIPYGLRREDVIVKAPTGTGKTFAFGIPMIEQIDPDTDLLQGLILAPTRELAQQITKELRGLCAYLPGIRTLCLYGGEPISRQITALKKRPQIVVATPGRLMDHMKRKTVRLHAVETVILDEADRMLDMGFVKDVCKILDAIPQRKNLGMFSATISREVLDISWVYQRDPVEITVRPVEENKPDIRQYVMKVTTEGKVQALMQVLEQTESAHVIVFCNTKNTADRLMGLLRLAGVPVEAIHGDLNQKVRERVLQDFRRGTLRVLVATDVASRGLDIDDVDLVINYDIPEETEYYIHRIGRTGRAGREGQAYSLVSSIPDRVRLDSIAKITGATLVEIAHKS